MKKTFIAICLSSCVFSVQATEPNSFYIGIKSGGASVHHGVSQFKTQGNSSLTDINRISVTYGAFAGYQMTQHLATEIGYEHFGQLAIDRLSSDDTPHFKHSAQGAQLSLKGLYPLTQNLDIFGKVGGAFVNNKYKFNDELNRSQMSKSNKLSPILGLGVDYKLIPELDFRVEYQWLGKAGKSSTLAEVGGVSKYSPDFHAMTVGFVYKFGQTPKAQEQENTAVQQVSKNFEFDTDILFDFAKANLKTQAIDTLDKVYTDIAALELGSANVYINGYSDRIGTESFNLALSQKRADNVANYMISKGLDSQYVTAIGHGNKYSVTGNQCDSIKNHKALIACLAPDRRVTLQVKGTK